MIKRIEASGTPLAHYLARYFQPGDGNDYMWDELAAAAWIDPSLITKREVRYMGVDISRGAGIWEHVDVEGEREAELSGVPVEIQIDLDAEKFYQMFVRLMSAPTPAH